MRNRSWPCGQRILGPDDPKPSSSRRTNLASATGAAATADADRLYELTWRSRAGRLTCF